MSKGECLCGAVGWEIKGPPRDAYHCHCTICRKAHAAAFGTYYNVDTKNFSWIGTGDTVAHYRTSESIERAFCSTCGSVVPDGSDDGREMYVPAGPHADGPAIDGHIFVGSKAPWFDITDGLPQHEAFADATEEPASGTPEAVSEDNGHVRGSCLCRAVAFEISTPFKVVHNCHCSRCRKARAAAFTTNGFTDRAGLAFIQGENNITVYEVPGAKFFGQAFCKTCGSGMPRVIEKLDAASVPFGSLDDDPERQADDHIFVADGAVWYTIADDLPSFEQGTE